jgi:hypothetical protein
MTKKELKKFHEWATGEIKATDSVTNEEIEFDVTTGLDSMPRVIYLRSLGYKFDSWEGYAQAEINEMGTPKKVA